MTRIKKYLDAAFLGVVLAFLFPAQSYSQSLPLPYWDVPIFQYAIFYNLNLEIDPGAVFPINGSVFCNAGMWSGSPNVTYASTVEAVGPVNTGTVDPFVSNGSKTDDGTPQVNFLYPGQPVTNVVPAYRGSFLFGESGITTNAESLINLPPSDVRAPQEGAYDYTNQIYDFNDASLIVSNWYWGSNSVVPWSNNFTVYLQDSTVFPLFVRSNGVPMNWIQLTNDYYIISNRYSISGYALFSTNHVPNFQFTNNVSSICWTNNPPGTNSVWYAGFSFLTNATFYDQRESATVRAVQLDVGKLRTWITNDAPNGGSNWNLELSEDIGYGIDSIFIYNAVPLIGQQQLPAVRVVNGMLLPSNGLTVVTPQPMYVWGSYNVSTIGHSALLNSHNTANTYPAAFKADALGGWQLGRRPQLANSHRHDN